MSTEESVRNETIHPDTVVNARLLGAQHVKISYKRIVQADAQDYGRTQLSGQAMQPF